MRKFIFFLIAPFIIYSCEPGKKEENRLQSPAILQENMSEMQVRTPEPVEKAFPDPEKGRAQKIIKDGDMTIRVDDIKPSRISVDSIIKHHQGYVSSERFANVEKYRRYYLVIRIPAGNFEAFLSELNKGIGEVVSRSIRARDVTEEYIDLETRLENKRKYLDRYHELLNKANSVEDILKIQEQIRQLEEEIETVTGRLEFLDNQVDYSTLNLTLEEEKPYTFSPAEKLNLPERLKGALVNGWTTFVQFLLGVIYLWPFIVAGLIVWFFVRQYRKRGKK
jgi:hypothetical protein